MSHTIYPQTISGRDVMTILPSWHCKSMADLQPLIVFHGHGALSAVDLTQGLGSFGTLPSALADRCGFAVSMMHIGTTWLDQQGMDWITALYNSMISAGAVGKAGLLGFSMGGGGALRWMIENPSLVACTRVYSPLTNLMTAFNNPGDPAWVTEMNADYANNVSANGQPRAPISNVAAYRGGPHVLISHPTDDTTLPFGDSQTFVTNVNDPAVTLRATNETGGHSVHDTDDAVVKWFIDHRHAA